jgi:DNA-binding NtrC family response regulator
MAHDPSPQLTVTLHSAIGSPAPETLAPGYLLVVESGSSAMFQLPQSGEVVVGRAPESALRVQDPSVSRQHARFRIARGEVVIEDLGSHNGTRVNGERITAPRRLLSGDVIVLCDVAIIYQLNHHHGPGAGQGPRVRPLHEDLTVLRHRLEEEVERALCSHRPLSLCALWTGPLAGSARSQLAQALGGALRVIDVAAWGGADHLIVLLPDSEAQGAQAAAARLVDAAAAVAPLSRAGLAGCPSDGYDVDALLSGARAAMDGAPPGQVGQAAAAAQTLTIGDRTVVLADPAMVRLYKLIDRLAQSDLPVLITGETGSGKEIAAQTLHTRSRRAAQRLVSINCAALPESLAESELFGHEKGAFSGAVAAKQGLLEAAHGGTVFFDEIGELPPGVQAKLLRVLETKKLMRVGEVRERTVDVRIIAATNRKLAEESVAGRFRQDLFFRLSSAVLVLPPLRDRQRELPILARTFLSEACARAGRPPLLIAPAAMDLLLRYSWPGNLRELRNAMDYAATVVTEPVLEPEHLPPPILAALTTPRSTRQPEEESSSLAQLARVILRLPVSDKLDAIESALVSAAMTLASGNKSAAARLLGVHRKVVERRMDRKEQTP